MRTITDINKDLKKLYAERDNILADVHKEILNTAFWFNGNHYYVIAFEKRDARLLEISGENVNVVTFPIEQVAQWREFEEKVEEFQEALENTQKFQREAIIINKEVK